MAARAAARFKVEEEKKAAADREAGRAAGEKWAADEVKEDELKRLARAVAESDGRSRNTGEPEDYVRTLENGRNAGAFAGLARDISGDDDAHPDVFWAQVWTVPDSDSLREPEFAIGFIEGALDVWEAARARADD